MFENHYLDLYIFSNQEYKSYLKSNTATEFVLDPIINKENFKEFILDPTLNRPKKEFVLDPQFPQHKFGGNGKS